MCAAVACNNPIIPGYKTCANRDHRACEEYYRLMGKAMFQLKHRLERTKLSQPTSYIPHDPVELATTITEDSAEEPLEGLLLHDEPVTVSNDGEVEPDEATDSDINCPSKPETGNRKVRARFGRKRTHNEELCVASCGVILGRETFFGSEGTKAVQVRLSFINLYSSG